MKRYFIKDVENEVYYAGINSLKWCKEISNASYFYNIETAESFVKGEDPGLYKIEEIYVFE